MLSLSCLHSVDAASTWPQWTWTSVRPEQCLVSTVLYQDTQLWPRQCMGNIPQLHHNTYQCLNCVLFTITTSDFTSFGLLIESYNRWQWNPITGAAHIRLEAMLNCVFEGIVSGILRVSLSWARLWVIWDTEWCWWWDDGKPRQWSQGEDHPHNHHI